MKTFILYSLLFFLLNSCAQDNAISKLNESNCIKTKGELSDLLKLYKKNITDSNLTKPFNIQFFNNPFQIDSTFQLVLIIKEKIIFHGNFSQYFTVELPNSFVSSNGNVKFILSKNKMNYTFNTMEVGKIEEMDNMLHIVFIPSENDWFTFYFNFTKSDKYSESP